MKQAMEALNKNKAIKESGAHQLVLGEHVLSREQAVDENLASKILGRAIQTLRNDRHGRRGCPYIKISRSVRYRVGDLLDYLEKNRVDPEAG